MKTSTTLSLPLMAKIAIAMTVINTWVLFEETVVDRHGLWRYMPYYRVGLFCVWDAVVFAVTLLLLVVSVRPFRHRDGTTLSITLSLPIIGKIAIAMTFLNTLVILFGWPSVLLRSACDQSRGDWVASKVRELREPAKTSSYCSGGFIPRSRRVCRDLCSVRWRRC
jgi:hypothetical protein